MKLSRKVSGLALASAALVLAGVAYAALPFSGANDSTINGCYSQGGNLKVLTPSEPVCPKGYLPIQWSVSGPQGIQGPVGPTGPQGPTGPAGPSGIGAVYTAENAKRVDTEVENQEELVGVSELPAGDYLVWFTVYINQGFNGLSGGNTNAVVCDLRASGSLVTRSLGTFDEESAGSFDRGALDGMGYAAVPTNGKLIVSCGKRLGDNPLLHGRIMAVRVAS